MPVLNALVASYHHRKLFHYIRHSSWRLFETGKVEELAPIRGTQ